MSLLCTGAVNGFGRVIPVVSDTAETSIAEGGAIVAVRLQIQASGCKFRIRWLRCGTVLACLVVVAIQVCLCWNVCGATGGHWGTVPFNNPAVSA